MTATRELELDTADTTADEPAALLEFARSMRAAADRAEAELLAAAARWAALHPGEGVITEADWAEFGGERSLPIAGPGAPDIAEFAIAEFALAIGLSSDAGRRYLGDAVELHHRLHRVTARVHRGDLPVWRARRIAAATRATPAPGTYLWSSPHGYTYLRDHLGTVDVSAPDRSPPEDGSARISTSPRWETPGAPTEEVSHAHRARAAEPAEAALGLFRRRR